MTVVSYVSAAVSGKIKMCNFVERDRKNHIHPEINELLGTN